MFSQVMQAITYENLKIALSAMFSQVMQAITYENLKIALSVMFSQVMHVSNIYLNEKCKYM
jgi:hypothetical protein